MRKYKTVITLTDYWMGRDKKYSAFMTNEIAANASALLVKINALLLLIPDDIDFELDPDTGTLMSSGWRPPPINISTVGAAKKSNHMFALAGDLYDPDGKIDDWCMNNLSVLKELDLYMEHPSATKGWCHLQSVPPKSQSRLPLSQRRHYFYP